MGGVACADSEDGITVGTQYYISLRGDRFRDAVDFAFYLGWGFKIEYALRNHKII